MKYFRCSIPVDPASALICQHLQEQGLLCADHRLRRANHEIVALRQSEIDLLTQAGIEVDVRSEVAEGPPANGADAISTGFVSGYLDSPGIDAAFANLHALFPSLTTFGALPESTTGYDGAVAALAGPSPIQLFR